MSQRMATSRRARSDSDASSQANVPFPRKLYDLIEAEEDALIEWSPEGGCFFIRDQDAFCEEVLAKYFRHTKLTSFQRQLNLYGFRRITKGPDTGAYVHPLFSRDDSSHVDTIKRVRKGGQSAPDGRWASSRAAAHALHHGLPAGTSPNSPHTFPDGRSRSGGGARGHRGASGRARGRSWSHPSSQSGASDESDGSEGEDDDEEDYYPSGRRKKPAANSYSKPYFTPGVREGRRNPPRGASSGEHEAAEVGSDGLVSEDDGHSRSGEQRHSGSKPVEVPAAASSSDHWSWADERGHSGLTQTAPTTSGVLSDGIYSMEHRQADSYVNQGGPAQFATGRSSGQSSDSTGPSGGREFDSMAYAEFGIDESVDPFGPVKPSSGSMPAPIAVADRPYLPPKLASPHSFPPPSAAGVFFGRSLSNGSESSTGDLARAYKLQRSGSIPGVQASSLPLPLEESGHAVARSTSATGLGSGVSMLDLATLEDDLDHVFVFDPLFNDIPETPPGFLVTPSGVATHSNPQGGFGFGNGVRATAGASEVSGRGASESWRVPEAGGVSGPLEPLSPCGNMDVA